MKESTLFSILALVCFAFFLWPVLVFKEHPIWAVYLWICLLGVISEGGGWVEDKIKEYRTVREQKNWTD